MIRNIKEEIEFLKQDMTQSGLLPEKPLILDGESHEYTVMVNGRPRRARYVAWLHPFDKKPQGTVLVCTYGFIDEKEFSYSSLVKK